LSLRWGSKVLQKRDWVSTRVGGEIGSENKALSENQRKKIRLQRGRLARRKRFRGDLKTSTRHRDRVSPETTGRLDDRFLKMGKNLRQNVEEGQEARAKKRLLVTAWEKIKGRVRVKTSQKRRRLGSLLGGRAQRYLAQTTRSQNFRQPLNENFLPGKSKKGEHSKRFHYEAKERSSFKRRREKKIT